MTIDAVTPIQYTGYFQSEIKKSLEQGKVAPEVEEARIQRILEEERKRIQRIVDARLRVIERFIIEKDVKRKRIEYREFGQYINILI